MKNILFLFFILYAQLVLGQEKNQWRTIPSLTDWIEEINAWPDTTYNVKYINLQLDPIKDKDLVDFVDNGEGTSGMYAIDSIYATINKPMAVTGLKIEGYGNKLSYGEGIIKNLRFKEQVRIYELEGLYVFFKNLIFEDQLIIRRTKINYRLNFTGCWFSNFMMNDTYQSPNIRFLDCEFKDDFYFSNSEISTPAIVFNKSKFQKKLEIGTGSTIQRLYVGKTTINGILDLENVIIKNALYVLESSLNGLEIEGASLPGANTLIPFNLVSDKILIETDGDTQHYKADGPSDMADEINYEFIIASYAKLLDVYQSRGDLTSYNACYTEMRNKQTAYSKYLFDKEPSFDNWLVYSLNKFLRIFSDYGTKPTKSIIFSLYVILAFALIYLFFPNSWDKHGKNRIIDRYVFFFKYMKKDAGIHEVYLEEKNEELMAYDEFKNLISSSEKSVPRFFSATAFPLYKWAISGTKLSAILLSRIDIMKGTWQEMPPSKKAWKSFLLVSTFLMALLYDFFIKMLNALMLSINTFTTLGFGEIPIKGLPRYLAIIQGFIGWFMLTIFSVSLISQLLN